jgi:hypothetical protein
LDTFAGQFGGYAGDPGDISARPRKARDQPRGDGISRLGHDDRDFTRCLLCRQSGGREPSDDHIDFATDQLGRQFGKPVHLSFRRSKLKSNVLPLDIPQIAQRLPKLPPKLSWIGIANDECADDRQLRRLLRACSKRQCYRRDCRAAEHSDELAPF